LLAWNDAMLTGNVVTASYEGFQSECLTQPHTNPITDAVLLVGGAFNRKETWGRFGVALAARTTLVAVDLPGWGDTEVLPASYGIDFLADALHELLTAAGHNTVNVFGGSYGGAIAYRLAQLYPEQVRRLALFGTMSRIPDHVRPEFLHTIDLVRSGRNEEFAECALRLLTCQDATIPILNRKVVARILRRVFIGMTPNDRLKYVENTLRLLQRDLYVPYPLITRPVLVGVGEHDPLTRPELCRDTAATCRDAWFVQLRDADHPVHLELPDGLADLMLRFFTGQSLDRLDCCRSVEHLTQLAALGAAG
jgi:pimeloyl-ACP methyl ester carboxylesterase